LRKVLAVSPAIGACNIGRREAEAQDIVGARKSPMMFLLRSGFTRDSASAPKREAALRWIGGADV
jgi:hypothetical protein